MKPSILLALAGTTIPHAPLSQEARKLIAPVHQAFVDALAVQSKLPIAKSNRERLERMGIIDQAGRSALVKIDLSVLTPIERDAAHETVWDEINAHDLANQRELKRLMPLNGWFSRAVYGRKASAAAFLIVQHAVNDPKLMQLTLRKLKPLAKRDEIEGQYYALLYDRIALDFEHKPQRYGTQVACDGGRWQVRNLESPDDVDERRRAVGMRESEAEYLKNFTTWPCT
jgi:hypothetical protein